MESVPCLSRLLLVAWDAGRPLATAPSPSLGPHCLVASSLRVSTCPLPLLVRTPVILDVSPPSLSMTSSQLYLQRSFFSKKSHSEALGKCGFNLIQKSSGAFQSSQTCRHYSHVRSSKERGRTQARFCRACPNSQNHERMTGGCFTSHYIWRRFVTQKR